MTKMKRKTVSYSFGLLSCLAMSPGVYAGTMGDPAYCYPDGWAFIAGAGQTGFMSSGTYTLGANGMSKTLGVKNFQFGFLGDLAIGYGRLVNGPFYLGSEFGALIFGNSKTTSQTSASNTTIVTTEPELSVLKTVTVTRSLSSSVTVSGNPVVPYLDLKPGLLISDNSFLFARIGVDYNQIKVRTTSNYTSFGQSVNTADGGDASTGASSAGFVTNHKKQRAGLRTGLGFEYLLTEKLGLSANYIYAFYSGLNTSTTGSIGQVSCDAYEACPVNADGTYAASGHSRMGDQQVLLELNYHLA